MIALRGSYFFPFRQIRLDLSAREPAEGLVQIFVFLRSLYFYAFNDHYSLEYVIVHAAFDITTSSTYFMYFVT